MRHINPILIAMTLISVLSGCGGGTLSGDGASEKKREKKSAEDGDQMASDPQVVTGAYLACEVSPADKSSAGDAVGCSVMSNNRKVSAGGTSKIEFLAEYKAAQKKPDQLNTSKGYQALFISPAAQTPETKYMARIFNGSTMVSELTCLGNQLPCVAPVAPVGNLTSLSLTTQGYWAADGSFNNAASTQAFKPACPNNPDLYCDGSGNMYSTSPSSRIDRDTKDNCISTSQSILGGLIKVGTLGMFDPMKMFDNVPQAQAKTVLNKGEACVMHKVAKSGQPAKFLNAGSGCYVALLNKGGQAINLIFRKSDIKNPHQLEQQLAQFHCK